MAMCLQCELTQNMYILIDVLSYAVIECAANIAQTSQPIIKECVANITQKGQPFIKECVANITQKGQPFIIECVADLAETGQSFRECLYYFAVSNSSVSVFQLQNQDISILA